MGWRQVFEDIVCLGLGAEMVWMGSVVRQLKQTAMNSCSMVTVFPFFSLPLALANGPQSTALPVQAISQLVLSIVLPGLNPL